MTQILILLTFSGFTMTLDAEQLYGITDMNTCQQHIPYIREEYRTSTDASCLIGDIENETHTT